MEKQVEVWDSRMGTGKTSKAIDVINAAKPEEKFIFITPYLKEIERVRKATRKNRKFYVPNYTSSDYYDDGDDDSESDDYNYRKHDAKSKMQAVKNALREGSNIISTHSIFLAADDEFIELIKSGNYTLILDEVIDVLTKAHITRSDIKLLLQGGHIEVDPNTHNVSWIGSEDAGRYADIYMYAKAGNIRLIEGMFMLQLYPPIVFQSFPKVCILTYGFEAQVIAAYFRIHGIGYRKVAVQMSEAGSYEFVPYDIKNENREEIADLIRLFDEERFLKIGANPTGTKMQQPLSTSWFSKKSNAKNVEQLRKDLRTFARVRMKGDAEEIYWTCTKGHKKKLQSAGLRENWLAMNTKATNDYAHCRIVAYMVNRFMFPEVERYCKAYGHPVNDDAFAVYEMLQFLFRSRIRNGEVVDVYIPSERMRNLLKKWVNYEI